MDKQPTDVIQLLMGFLNQRDRARFHSCCRHFRDADRSDSAFWKMWIINNNDAEMKDCYNTFKKGFRICKLWPDRPANMKALLLAGNDQYCTKGIVRSYVALAGEDCFSPVGRILQLSEYTKLYQASVRGGTHAFMTWAYQAVRNGLPDHLRKNISEVRDHTEMRKILMMSRINDFSDSMGEILIAALGAHTKLPGKNCQRLPQNEVIVRLVLSWRHRIEINILKSKNWWLGMFKYNWTKFPDVPYLQDIIDVIVHQDISWVQPANITLSILQCVKSSPDIVKIWATRSIDLNKYSERVLLLLSSRTNAELIMLMPRIANNIDINYRKTRMFIDFPNVDSSVLQSMDDERFETVCWFKSAIRQLIIDGLVVWSQIQNLPLCVLNALCTYYANVSKCKTFWNTQKVGTKMTLGNFIRCMERFHVAGVCSFRDPPSMLLPEVLLNPVGFVWPPVPSFSTP